MGLRRYDALALLWLLAIFLVVEKQARIWHPLTWVGDLGNLPYQCLRMSWGDVIYRDFAAKNPLGVFLFPSLIFRTLGPSIDTLAFLTALQFTALISATYLVARRSAPRWAWVVAPLSWSYCMASCGLIHHPWAAAVGLLAVSLLYDCLFRPEPRMRGGWWLGGVILGVVGLFHQVLFCMLSLAVVLYCLATGEKRRGTLAVLIPVTLATILCAYGLLALAAGDPSLVGRALKSNLAVLFFHQKIAINNPLIVSDLWLFAPMEPGPAGLAHRFLEILNKALTYFGFPVLATLALWERRRRGRERDWLSWLLLSGGLISLSAYPQFIFAHIRAFLAPFSFILIARRLEGPGRNWVLGLAVALVSLLGLEEAAVTLATARYPVRFPVGVVYLGSEREAGGFQAICDEMSGGGPLLVYPYFPMAYFLFLRSNPFRIHEIYPSKLMPATGVALSDPVYLEGMQALAERPPRFALNAVGAQRLFLNLEQMETRPDPGNPLLDFMHEHYEPVRETQLDDGSPWIVLLKWRN